MALSNTIEQIYHYAIKLASHQKHLQRRIVIGVLIFFTNKDVRCL